MWRGNTKLQIYKFTMYRALVNIYIEKIDKSIKVIS